MSKSPQEVLIWSLYADGLKSSEIAGALSTPTGIDRAFRKLESIEKHIDWIDYKSEGTDQLRNRDVVMTPIWSSNVGEFDNVGFIWDGHILRYDYMVIPSDARNYDEAIKFLGHNVATDFQVRFSVESGFGPTQYEAISNLGIPFQCAEGTCACEGTNTCSKKCCKENSIILPLGFWTQDFKKIERRFNRLVSR